MFKHVLIGLFVLTVVAGSLAYVAYASRSAAARAEAAAEAEVVRYREGLTAVFDEALSRLAAATERLSGRFEPIDDLKTAQELQLLRYRSVQHLQKARGLGVGRVSGQTEIERLVAQGRLVRLEDTPYFYVQELDLSVPYVTPDAARLLELIGERFHAELRAHGLPLYRYCISSVLRTAENQGALRQINPNAAGGISTHEFGTTLDIVYHKYRYWPQPDDALPPTAFGFLDERLEDLRVRAYDALGMRYWQELQGILGRVLIDLQREGAVYVLLERNQPVFHITVARTLAES